MAWGHREPPKESGKYLVTAVSCFTGGRYVCIADRCEHPRGNFIWRSTIGGYFNDKIIAWQKLTKPYEG